MNATSISRRGDTRTREQTGVTAAYETMRVKNLISNELLHLLIK